MKVANTSGRPTLLKLKIAEEINATSHVISM